MRESQSKELLGLFNSPRSVSKDEESLRSLSLSPA